MKTMKGGTMTGRRKHRKQQECMLETLIITTLVAICVTLILAVGDIYINFNVYRKQQIVETLSKDLEVLQKEVDAANQKQVEYKKQIDQLQAQLSKYQDVVIPDSMTS